MKTETSIFVTDQFVGFHCWTTAPNEVAFLRVFHRHIFHVKLVVKVQHNYRDVEFFMLKRQLTSYLEKFRNEQFFLSCEEIALDILEEFSKRFACLFCLVDEDGENGAVVQVKQSPDTDAMDEEFGVDLRA